MEAATSSGQPFSVPARSVSKSKPPSARTRRRLSPWARASGASTASPATSRCGVNSFHWARVPWYWCISTTAGQGGAVAGGVNVATTWMPSAVR